MHYELLGFSQTDAMRRFVFARILGDGSASAEFTVVADVALARKFRITLQELPSLCSRLLESLAEDQAAGAFHITHAYMEVHAAAKESAAQQDQAKRILRSRRAALAAAGKTLEGDPPSNSTVTPDPVTFQVIP